MEVSVITAVVVAAGATVGAAVTADADWQIKINIYV